MDGLAGISLTTLTSRSTVITQMYHLLPLDMLDQLARPPDLNVATIMNDDLDDYQDKDDNDDHDHDDNENVSPAATVC